MMPLPVPVSGTDAGARNVRLLSALRWLAVAGQLGTIVAVSAMGVDLRLAPMLAALAVLVALNLALGMAAARRPITDGQLFATFLVDVAVLTAQLYLSGGVGNPFVTLYLLQVVIAAVLLPIWSSWALAALTSALFAALALLAPPFALPPRFASSLSIPYVAGGWLAFTLTAALLVLFVTRIARNLSQQAERLAALRQRAAEEEHIVRMGLLASGAAHELGTPLSSIAVMLGDWRCDPAVAASPELLADLDDMRVEVMRCKDILSHVLAASGEPRGHASQRTGLRAFLGEVVDGWNATGPLAARYEHHLPDDPRIVADRTLAQTLTNLLDNAQEAGAGEVVLTARREGELLLISVRDDGRGFAPAVLAAIGKPYLSTKDRRGAGLGLFLATNVLRTLGGTVHARNLKKGSEVTLQLPRGALSVPGAAA